jgi:hypothetical protein
MTEFDTYQRASTVYRIIARQRLCKKQYRSEYTHSNSRMFGHVVSVRSLSFQLSDWFFAEPVVTSGRLVVAER